MTFQGRSEQSRATRNVSRRHYRRVAASGTTVDNRAPAASHRQHSTSAVSNVNDESPDRLSERCKSCKLLGSTELRQQALRCLYIVLKTRFESAISVGPNCLLPKCVLPRDGREPRPRRSSHGCLGQVSMRGGYAGNYVVLVDTRRLDVRHLMMMMTTMTTKMTMMMMIMMTMMAAIACACGWNEGDFGEARRRVRFSMSSCTISQMHF